MSRIFEATDSSRERREVEGRTGRVTVQSSVSIHGILWVETTMSSDRATNIWFGMSEDVQVAADGRGRTHQKEQLVGDRSCFALFPLPKSAKAIPMVYRGVAAAAIVLKGPSEAKAANAMLCDTPAPNSRSRPLNHGRRLPYLPYHKKNA